MADTSFDVEIDVDSATVEPAAAKLATLATNLTAASSAAAAAADAVKGGEQAYAQAEATADRAAKAVERIGIQADAQRGKLEQALNVGDDAAAERAASTLQKLLDRQGEAAIKAQQASGALVEQATALDRLRDAARVAADEEGRAAQALDAEKLAQNARDASEATEEGTGSARTAARAFGALGGPVGVVGQKLFAVKDGFEKLGSSLGAANGAMATAAIGIGVVLAIVVALGAALVSSTVSIAKWAITMSDAARTSSLMSAGIAGTVEGGKALDDKIAELQDRVPLTAQELLGLAKNLQASGLRGKELAAAMDDAAVKAAKVKMGPNFQEGLVSLDMQAERLHRNLAKTFHLDTDQFLAGLDTLGRLLDSNTESGKAIQAVFQKVFQPLIDGATDLVPAIERAFIKLEIYFLKAAIAVAPFWGIITKVGEVLAILAALVVGVVIAALVSFGVAVAVIVAPFVAIWVAVAALIDVLPSAAAAVKGWASSVWDSIVGTVQGAIDWLKNLSLMDIGRKLIEGLVQGIAAAAGAVGDAVKSAAQGAITAAKSALGIHSPSTVFAEIGEQTGAGLVGGVDKSSDKVQGAFEGMVAPPQGQAGGQASGGAKGSIDLSGAQFVFNGVEGAEDAEARFGGLLTRLLEGDATQLGLSP